ncbi:MAG: AI-2E family transporter [Chloroflexi bacterium]|nr:AI-2E family transporter [Chloroflexota bacterium]
MAVRPLPPPWRWWPVYVLVGAGAIVAVVAALRAIGELLSPVRHALFIVLFAIVVAFLLAPLVARLERLLQRRSLALLASVLLAIAAILAIGTFAAAPIVREVRDLAQLVPQYVEELRSDRPFSVAGVEIPGELRRQAGQFIAEHGDDLAEQTARAAMRVVSAVIDVVLVIVLATYLLAGAPRIRQWIIGWVPKRWHDLAEDVEDDLADVFGRYVRAQLLLALVIGVVSIAAYSILGVRHALFLGILAGILELVPIVGPIVAGTVAAGIALFQPFPLIVWVIIAAILIQQIENNILVPRISGAAVGVSPVAALLAVLFAIEAAGIVGGIFAVPIVGVLARLASRMHEPAEDLAKSARAAEREGTAPPR